MSPDCCVKDVPGPYRGATNRRQHHEDETGRGRKEPPCGVTLRAIELYSQSQQSDGQCHETGRGQRQRFPTGVAAHPPLER